MEEKTKARKILEFIITVFIIYNLIDGVLAIASHMFLHSVFTTFDAVQFISSLFVISMVIYAEQTEKIQNKLFFIEKSNEAVLEAVHALMVTKNKELEAKKTTLPNSKSALDEFFKDLGSGMSGSISLVDLNNPDKITFQGNFENEDEMKKLRDELINNMLNSETNFKGKTLTKKETLEQMTKEEVQQELDKAIVDEDYIWASKLRDKLKTFKG